MQRDDGLPARAAIQVGMHHVAHDRPRPDDGDLDDEVIEALGVDAGQRRHLRPALHLEDADRVSLL